MALTTLTVTGSSQTTRDIVRVHFRSDDLSAFAESIFTDRYVKLVFPKPGTTLPAGVGVRELRTAMPADEQPELRTYTALHPDLEAGTLDIDFVVHGDEGVAGPWAARAQAGDVLVVGGPGGAYRPDADAAWHLLVGDETALPAVLAAIEALPADAVGEAVLLVEPGGEAALEAPAGVRVTWVHRDDAATPLLDAVRALPWREGRVHAFVHGEAGEVMHGLRPFLLRERGVAKADLSISGYWRRGRSEPGFREWKRELAEAEQSMGAAEAAPRAGT